MLPPFLNHYIVNISIDKYNLMLIIWVVTEEI